MVEPIHVEKLLESRQVAQGPLGVLPIPWAFSRPCEVSPGSAPAEVHEREE